MRYMGGKARISGELSKFINKELKEGQPFVDLFCGSCNVVSKIESDRVRIANDLHKELIAMWEYVQSGGDFPETFTEEEFEKARHNKEGLYPDWLRGLVGFGCAFAGSWFTGFARGGNRIYYNEAKRGVAKKIATMKGVIFTNYSYESVNLPPSSLIYCDIPYKGTTQYSTGSFCHDTFIKWAIETTKSGHKVLVSEYGDTEYPDNFKLVWSKASRKSLRDSTGEQKETVEVLYEVVV